jgi:hypothetical protein
MEQKYSTTFENAKVGDKVYSPTFGWGEIIDTSNFKHYPLGVRFLNNDIDTHYFTLEGYYHMETPIQSLFWGEVAIEAPKKPVGVKVINGVEIPNITIRPDNRENYHYPYSSHPQLYSYTSFTVGDNVDEFRAAHDMCYPISPEGKVAAILHAKAMLGIAVQEN